MFLINQLFQASCVLCSLNANTLNMSSPTQHDLLFSLTWHTMCYVSYRQHITCIMLPLGYISQLKNKWIYIECRTMEPHLPGTTVLVRLKPFFLFTYQCSGSATLLKLYHYLFSHFKVLLIVLKYSS